ncbi:MAG TPA: hypothetical protein PKV98_09605 [Burkholderiaceae bacterium]|nr:hypothetical protein [Burkholderiaceae bacterium]
MTSTAKLKDGDLRTVVGGTHKGRSGTVRDVRTSKTGLVTVTVEQHGGVRFRTLGRNVRVQTAAIAGAGG